MSSISHNACVSVDAANEGMTSREAQSNSNTKNPIQCYFVSALGQCCSLGARTEGCVEMGLSACTLFTNQAKQYDHLPFIDNKM